MATDKEIAIRVLDLQKRARDYALVEIPSYRRWSEQKLNEGVSEALIANLDARSVYLLPEEVNSVGDDEFEELLSDLIDTVGE
ncbi:hypothetical protein GCM10027046_34250 [Uliginosibacterium flavum]|uniref:Uncharacterized protein n=1 Tax=Uliginosibacterium flavum TaxID=1396831 RepID=A0ABV2TMK4_9RHOO